MIFGSRRVTGLNGAGRLALFIDEVVGVAADPRRSGFGFPPCGDTVLMITRYPGFDDLEGLSPDERPYAVNDERTP
jgi:hypothetical protein